MSNNDTPKIPPNNETSPTPKALPKVVVISGAALLGALFGAILWMLMGPDTGQRQGQVQTTLQNGYADIGGPFTLTDHNGRSVTEKTFKNDFKLVYFGYTYCPDVCPLGLLLMHDMLNELGKKGEQIQPLFITLDPERDTPKVLGDYISSFHPRLLGLTGSPEEVAAVADAYKLYYRKAAMPGGDEAVDYAVDHMNIIYLMGPDGTYLTHFINPTSPKDIAAAVRKHLK